MILKPEELLLKKVSNYMITDWNKIPFRVDVFADVKLPTHVASRLHALHNPKFRKGYPDLFIATCRGGYGGLYIELKATKEVQDTEHTRTQAQVHAVLRYNGYKVEFACGYKEAKKAIKKYLKSK